MKPPKEPKDCPMFGKSDEDIEDWPYKWLCENCILAGNCMIAYLEEE